MKKQLYIGDPCYCLKDNLYKGVWGKKNKYQDGAIFDPDKNKKYGIVHGTAAGDGEYRLLPYGGEIVCWLPVDSGTLSIIDLSSMNEDDVNKDIDYGYLVDVVGELKSYDLIYKDGLFQFVWSDDSGLHELVCNTDPEEY